jgi:acyl carrier protein
MDATSSEDALRELGRLCSAGVTRMCVARFDLQRLGRILPGTLVPRFSPIITPAAASLLNAEETLASRLTKVPSSEGRDLVLQCVQMHAAKVLGAGSGQLDQEQPLAALGLDSLMAVELAVALERDLEKPISVMQLLSAGSISAIADLAFKLVNTQKAVVATENTHKERELVG